MSDATAKKHPFADARWIDSHCHLQAPEFAADRDAVWSAARAAGVTNALVPAVTLADCARVDACCARCAGLFPAYGIHPLFVAAVKETQLARLAKRLARVRPQALGEIGLDGWVKDADFPRQCAFFAAQLKLARDFDLPVILHVRKAIDAVLRHLRRFRVQGGIAHAFNGSRRQADEFLRLGFKLGFGGSLTYSGSTRIRALAQTLPDEAIVLETDAPDIPPSWRARCRNSPAELPAIGHVLAELRAAPISHIAALTRRNTLAALGYPEPEEEPTDRETARFQPPSIRIPAPARSIE
ncbi:MAG: TatD family hydrolase [Zoogloeaceae bacterium]|jgi:TatD DNase family protein|nr:TatD family hydrolase [Zoogloeaceae bacterium]